MYEYWSKMFVTLFGDNSSPFVLIAKRPTITTNAM